MAFLLAVSDFKGPFNVAQDVHEQTITIGYIDAEEKSTIRKIFGVSLGNDINDYIDLNMSPINPDLDALINPQSFQDGRCVQESKGLKYMLLGLIWFKMNTEGATQAGQNGGQSIAQAEMSAPARANPSNYVNSVRSIRAIQRYCQLNRSVYPTFAGERFETTWMI